MYWYNLSFSTAFVLLKTVYEVNDVTDGIVLVNDLDYLEIKISIKLQVSYVASYMDLEYDTSLKHTSILKSIHETVTLRLNTVECVYTVVSCFQDIAVVTDCSKRRKRSLSDCTAGVNISLSCEPYSRTL